MRNAVGFVVFAICAVIGYQAYENAQLRQETLELSRDAVCSLYGGCARGQPSGTQTDIVRRQYEWLTPQGPYVATCKRKAIFFGAWSCDKVERKQLHAGRDY